MATFKQFKYEVFRVSYPKDDVMTYVAPASTPSPKYVLVHSGSEFTEALARAEARQYMDDNKGEGVFDHKITKV